MGITLSRGVSFPFSDWLTFEQNLTTKVIKSEWHLSASELATSIRICILQQSNL